MPNYVLATFNKTGPAPRVAHTTVPGYAYLTINDLTAEGNVDFVAVASKYGLGNPDASFRLCGYDKNGDPSPDSFPWQETNFSSGDPKITSNLVKAVGQRLDSYTIQALRNKVLPVQNNVVENAVQGMLARDGRFILGSRAGGANASDQGGTLQPIPGGGVRWKDSYHSDPLTDAFVAEAYEEAGATRMTGIRLYGIFNQVTQHINRQSLFIGEPEQSIGDLIGKIESGITFYQQQLAKGKSKRESRLALRESCHPMDVWENTRVWSFPYNVDTFLQLLSDGHWINPQGGKMKLIGSLPADLYIAGVVEGGPDFKKEADKLSFAQKEIIDKTRPKRH